MTRAKGVFKKVKNKGNRYYRTYPGVSEVASEVRNESSPSTSAPHTATPSSSSSKKKLAKCDELYSNKRSANDKGISIIIDLSILSSVISEFTSCSLCGGKTVSYTHLHNF